MMQTDASGHLAVLQHPLQLLPETRWPGLARSICPRPPLQVGLETRYLLP